MSGIKLKCAFHGIENQNGNPTGNHLAKPEDLNRNLSCAIPGQGPSPSASNVAVGPLSPTTTTNDQRNVSGPVRFHFPMHWIISLCLMEL